MEIEGCMYKIHIKGAEDKESEELAAYSFRDIKVSHCKKDNNGNEVT